MLSVIVPIYNVELYLEKALDSLAKQELQDVEFLLICDGVVDSSPHIAQKYVKKDPRFRLIVESNKGYGATCNLGIKEAQGDYIAIFEPDDYISHQMYIMMYSLAKEHNVDIVCCNFIRNENNHLSLNQGFLRYISGGKDNALIPSVRPINEQIFYGESSIHRLCFEPFEVFSRHSSIWTKLYRKAFLQEKDITFLQTSGASFQDYPFHIETFTKARKILFINEALYYYRIHGKNSAIKLFQGPHRYIYMDFLEHLLGQKHIMNFIPEYAFPSYYRSFLHQYIWGLKASRNPKFIWKYCTKMSTWMSKHPWVTDSSYTLEELELLAAYKTKHHLSQFFYSIKAIIFQFRPDSFLARLCLMAQKILTTLRIIKRQNIKSLSRKSNKT